MCTAAELAQENVALLDKGPESEEVCYVRSKSTGAPSDEFCFKCRDPRHRHSDCTIDLTNVVCYNCKKIEHLKRACLKKRKGRQVEKMYPQKNGNKGECCEKERVKKREDKSIHTEAFYNLQDATVLKTKAAT